MFILLDKVFLFLYYAFFFFSFPVLICFIHYLIQWLEPSLQCLKDVIFMGNLSCSWSQRQNFQCSSIPCVDTECEAMCTPYASGRSTNSYNCFANMYSSTVKMEALPILLARKSNFRSTPNKIPCTHTTGSLRIFYSCTTQK